ncbi:MAG: LytTR family transcriptional regulator [Candidatus Cloacimonetes bacterium]|nr:LytTR family transcriptional regulator [Candidatus Cloacimonadota bacterium]
MNSFIIITEQNRFLKKNLELAGVLNSSLSSKSETADQILPEDESVVELCSEVVKEKIELHPADLLYIKAVENYIEIVTGSRGAQNKKILRCTLKNAEKALENYNYLVRCHRSFIVNTSRIENVTGNSQGIKLKLTGCEIPVPVSRSNASKLKAMLS